MNTSNQNNSCIGKYNKRLDGKDLSEKVKSKEKMVFCPACEQIVPLKFAVSGLCKDCFDND